LFGGTYWFLREIINFRTSRILRAISSGLDANYLYIFLSCAHEIGSMAFLRDFVTIILLRLTLRLSCGATRFSLGSRQLQPVVSWLSVLLQQNTTFAAKFWIRALSEVFIACRASPIDKREYNCGHNQQKEYRTPYRCRNSKEFRLLSICEHRKSDEKRN